MADALQAAHRQHDLAAGLVQDLPANEPGVARLRDDADPGLVREREDARDLLGAAGPQHERRAADVAVAPFAQVGELLVGVGDGVRRASSLPKACDEARAWAQRAAAWRRSAWPALPLSSRRTRYGGGANVVDGLAGRHRE